MYNAYIVEISRNWISLEGDHEISWIGYFVILSCNKENLKNYWLMETNLVNLDKFTHNLLVCVYLAY